MILSKLRSAFLVLAASTVISQACRTPANSNTSAVPAQTVELKNETPFSTSEPAVYEGDFFAGTGDYENHWFVAKKAGNWRIDFFTKNKLDWSELKTDKLYVIDHKRKIYTIEQSDNSLPSVESSYFTNLLSGFFKSGENHEFEDLGHEGNLRKYKVRSDSQSKDETLLYVDEPTGVVVKQEFIAHNEQEGAETQTKYHYEIQNLSLDVDNKRFQLPEGYRMVTLQDYQSGTNAK